MKGLKHYPKTLQVLFYFSFFLFALHLANAVVMIVRKEEVSIDTFYVLIFVIAVAALFFYDMYKDIQDIEKRLDKLDPPGDDKHD
jgi:4-hydroxybenzoate polyprenyltransferase